MPLTTLAQHRRVLESHRLVLTPFQQQHVRTHYRWNNDPELNQLDSEHTFAKESFGSFARRFEAMILDPAPDAQDYEIHLRSGKLIGVAYFADLDPTHRRGTMGVTLGDRSEWGKGYGREVVQTLTQHGFGALGLHRITSHAFGFNAAWHALLQSVGFREEGCLRDYLYRDGQYWSKTQYALLEHEYRVPYALAA